MAIASSQGALEAIPSPLPAPTVYIAVESQLWDKNLVSFEGTSNLPPGSIITFDVGDSHGDGWDFYRDPVYASIDDKGTLKGARSAPNTE